MQATNDGVEALAAIARAVAAGAELGDVFGRLAETARPLLPAERIGVCWTEGAGGVQLRDLSAARDARLVARSDLSPRLWPPEAFEAGLLDDAGAHLDPSFRVDREIAEAGVRTLLRAPVSRAADQPGLLWMGSSAPGTLTPVHLGLARAIADLVSLALAQDRLLRAERERRRRAEALESLLPALAEVLDVRDVFRQVSRIAQEVLPHDLLGLAVFSEDHRNVRVFAASDPQVAELPEFPIPEDIVPTLSWDFFLAREITLFPGTRRARVRAFRPDGNGEHTVEVEMPEVGHRLISGHGIKCQLRVPLRRGGKVVGGLVFNSRTPEHFRLEDADVARRIADHVALALSHQRLADEQRQLERARERAAQLETRVAHLTEELEAKGTHRVLGRSKKWRDVLSQAAKVAGTDTTVLITGESGTGKEVVARFVHRASTRKDGPFVALNCAALPEQLLESELFGHEKGAFTGAVAQRAGRIEQAAGGVLFLDEVGEMSPAVQAKFLRVLQEREFQRLGGTRTLKADIRVLAATNRDLKAAIAGGGFREDLFYRLAVFDLALPPLRERPEDLLLLVDAFLEEIGRAVGRVPAGVSREVRDTLLAYPWPGNVRELRNALERAVILCEGSLITSEHLPITLKDRVPAAPAPAPGGEVDFPAGGVDLDALEKSLVLKALERARNNKAQAAKLLGLTRSQLYSRLGKHGLQP
jgi:transcriptional regulator with GAF, ATPase, and Fis domain